MKKILVIEDNAAVLSTILKLLKAEGYWVVSAEDGLAGLLAAQQHIPNLIICDVMMPQLDGYGVLTAIRQHPSTSTIPFIFLTAKADKSDFRQGMELGSDDYLTKPFTRQELLNAVKSQLSKQAIINQHHKQKLDELRGNISQSLPHQFLIPVVKILSLSDLLLHNSHALEAHEIPEIGGNIYTIARDLHHLIQNFLLYAELEVTEFDSPKAIELRQNQVSDPIDIVKEVSLRIAQQHDRLSDLKLDIQEDGVIAILTDHFERIVSELLDNAFKFSPIGTPVSLLASIRDRNFVLSISDRGQGMTEDQIANLGAYMQFEQRLYSKQGSGLGLAIAKRLAELYKGSLSIESSPYQGTVVNVELPLV